jgi:hypothetical protein
MNEIIDKIVPTIDILEIDFYEDEFLKSRNRYQLKRRRKEREEIYGINNIRFWKWKYLQK